MTTIRNPKETTLQVKDGEVEVTLVDEEDPQRKVTFRFTRASIPRELGHYLMDAALDVEKANPREGGT